MISPTTFHWRRTRAYQEFVVTQSLFDQGLPVAKPMAGQVVKHGLYYQADLITAKEAIGREKDLLAVKELRAIAAKRDQA